MRLYLVLIGILSLAGNLRCLGGDKFINDKTKKLESIISSFELNYDYVHSTRRAFICEGKLIESRKEGISYSEIRRIAYFEKDSIYRASSFLRHDENGPAGREQWVQHLLVNGKLHQRLGPFSSDQFDVLSDDEKIEEKQKSINRFSPLDNCMLPSQFLSFSPQGRAYIQLTANQLVSADYDGADIVQVVRTEGGLAAREMRYRWSRLEGTETYLPVHYEAYRINVSGDEENLELAAYVKSEWHKVDDFFVPKRLLIVGFDPSRSRQCDLSVEYRFLDGPTEPATITVELADWREPLRVLFGKEWARRGGFVPLLQPVVVP